MTKSRKILELMSDNVILFNLSYNFREPKLYVTSSSEEWQNMGTIQVIRTLTLMLDGMAEHPPAHLNMDISI